MFQIGLCARVVPTAAPEMEAEVEAFLLAQATAWQDRQWLEAANKLIDGMDALLRREGLLQPPHAHPI